MLSNARVVDIPDPPSLCACAHLPRIPVLDLDLILFVVHLGLIKALWAGLRSCRELSRVGKQSLKSTNPSTLLSLQRQWHVATTTDRNTTQSGWAIGPASTQTGGPANNRHVKPSLQHLTFFSLFVFMGPTKIVDQPTVTVDCQRLRALLDATLRQLMLSEGVVGDGDVLSLEIFLCGIEGY